MRNFVFVSPNFPESYWQFCRAIRDRGFNVLGIGDCYYDKLPQNCKNSLTEYYFVPDMTNFDDLVRAIDYFKNKYGEIDYIESNNEFRLISDARIRSLFGISTGPSEEEIKVFRYKSRQKEYYEKAGVKCARYSTSKDLDELKKFAKKVGYPIFAKPDDGVGAKGVKKIKNDADLTEFLGKIPENTVYIFEEYVDGQIISFDGITDDDANLVFYTSHFFLEDNAALVENALDDLYYCIPTKFIDKKFVEDAQRIVKIMNVRKRFFHFEWFQLKSDHKYLGKKGTMIPLEFNNRPAGGFTPDLINFANSINVYELYADVIAFNENREYMDFQKYYACCCSRRDIYNYVHTFDEVMEKYRNHICFFGDYDKAIRDDMGDHFVMAKFDTIEQVYEFDAFYREKR